jgi:hypothetical protein
MHRCDHLRDDIDRRFDELLSRSIDAFRDVQRRFQAEIGAFSRWHYDLASCMLSLKSSTATVDYPIVPIATYVHSAREWLWAWANDSFPTVAREAAESLKALHKQTEYRIFEAPASTVAENDLEELVAIAIHHLGAHGLFRSRTGDTTLLLAVFEKRSEPVGRPNAAEPPPEFGRQ